MFTYYSQNYAGIIGAGLVNLMISTVQILSVLFVKRYGRLCTIGNVTVKQLDKTLIRTEIG